MSLSSPVREIPRDEDVPRGVQPTAVFEAKKEVTFLKKSNQKTFDSSGL